MPNLRTPLELLAMTPVTKLSIGKASFRRSLERKGFSNLIDVLNMADNEIDKIFSLDDAYAIEHLQEAFRDDPEGFAERALDKPISIQSGPEKTNHSAPRPPQTRNKEHRRFTSSVEWDATQIDPYAHLHLPFSQDLSKYEERARRAFDDLCDRQNVVIVYQCFDIFATEFDEINESFQALFNHFAYQPKHALAFIDKFLPNIFLVYVADRARTFHEQRGFWNKFFPTVHFSSAGPETQAFKRVFYSRLQLRDMPVYQEDESARHYYLTALLHGGLSRSSWKALWETSILPLARSSRPFGNGSQTDIDGRTVLKTILDVTNAYTPPKTELELLRKAPVALAAPLLESALHVGMQVESNSKSGTGPTMLTSYGLPDVAIDALIDLKNEQAGNGNKNNTMGQTVRREFLALPKADLQLDISRGRVGLYWNKQLFPLSTSKRRIDYYVDSVKKGEQLLGYSVDKCTLDAMRIDITPRPQYEVALKLMELNEHTGTWKEIASLEQNFERLNPGCFEFILDAKKKYSLRRPNDRITRRRTVAYVLDKGLTVEPGSGMELIERYVPQDAWNETTIHVYMVSPGANGSIVAIKDDGTKEELAVWQENYRSNIDKTGLLGTTLGGVDLYGFTPNEDGNNIGLPSFYIEAFDGRSALDDLDIVCRCDDDTTIIKREILWESEEEDSGSARIKLSPDKSLYFYLNKHINLCTIEARQCSAGKRPIFKYRFCVAPIQDFQLASIACNGCDLDAIYTFESPEDIYVIDQNHTVQNMNADGLFTFSRPLSSCSLSIRIVSSVTAKITDAIIDLAALDISVPRHLVERAQISPLCLPDAQAGYADGLCSIKSGNWSQSRAVLVRLGNIPLYYRELSRPSFSSFSVFENIDNFLQTDGEDARDLPLSLCVYYGYKQSDGVLVPAYAETTLLNCREGLGFKTYSLRYDRYGTAFVKFDAPLRCEVQATFRQTNACDPKWRAKPFTQVINEGESRITLPKGIATALQRNRIYEMSLTPSDAFDEFDGLSFDEEEDECVDIDSPNGLTTTFILKGADHRDE